MIVQWIGVLVGLALIAFTAVYVAAEFSLVTVDRAAVDRRAGAGDTGAASVLVALKHLSTQLSGAQVGITITTLALGYVMEPALADLLSSPFTADPDSGVIGSVASVIALVIASAVSMVFGELVPKNFAVAQPLATAKTVVRPLRISTALFRPLIWALDGVANGVLRLFGIEPQEELRSARSPQELRSLVLRSAESGTIGDSHAGLVSRSLGFSSKTAGDVLTPRVLVHFIRTDDTAAEVIRAATHSGHSRFPVIGADADDVVGLVHLKAAVAVDLLDRETVEVQQLMVAPVLAVPATRPLDDLLRPLQGGELQFAVVIDEYGGTAGILTLEDIVEELVGEIDDEQDSRPSRALLQDDGSWLVQGTTRPDEISELTGVRLPEGAVYETVAGLLMAGLGEVPRSRDTVLVRAAIRAGTGLGMLADFPGDRSIEPVAANGIDRPAEVRLTVDSMEGHRVVAVRLSSVTLLGDPE